MHPEGPDTGQLHQGFSWFSSIPPLNRNGLFNDIISDSCVEWRTLWLRQTFAWRYALFLFKNAVVVAFYTRMIKSKNGLWARSVCVSIHLSACTHMCTDAIRLFMLRSTGICTRPWISCLSTAELFCRNLFWNVTWQTMTGKYVLGPHGLVMTERDLVKQDTLNRKMYRTKVSEMIFVP